MNRCLPKGLKAYPQLQVFLDGFFVIFLWVIGKIINRYLIMFYVFYDL